MKNTLLLVILICQIGKAQSLNQKVIVLPENTSVEDFSFLKEEIKEAQVVMLGEKIHFDGNVFEMKTKIVESLHQEMGFNTISFESGIYDVWKAQKNINKGVITKEALKKSLFTIWAKRKEFQNFINYFDRNKKDLSFITSFTATYFHTFIAAQLQSKIVLSILLNHDNREISNKIF
ncbi:hypothetical protein [Flavobacterium sp. KACC 22763]|uniref:hypothetical protein n=1 Tax=Flavobacterium sp. KACC 22763 TaxID=3025668 RepID=UPI002366F75C|nr:hypothetical protein [Flavobacterium sp. KACC 22763]WDF66167.1 hypothetical protein PQ463_08370 [Flavobacterium sp. KACC 22763]